MVSDFIRNKEPSALAGMILEGMDSLLEIVYNEIMSQEPDANTLKVDRELLSDERVVFTRDFEAFVGRQLDKGKKLNLLICGAIPVQNWNTCFAKYKGRDLEVYYFDYNYKMVPTCTRIPV